jgi:carotenoid cleavage dioxygenase
MTETDVNRDPSGEAPESRNGWLEGPFAPVDQEVTVHDLKVTGTIPADLDGRLLRCGPNPVDPENPVTFGEGGPSGTESPGGSPVSVGC